MIGKHIINIGYQHTVSVLLFVGHQLQTIWRGSNSHLTAELKTDEVNVNDMLLQETTTDTKPLRTKRICFM